MTRIRQAFAEHPTATTVTVVVAALLLVGLAVVLAVNVLGTRDEVADASPSAPPASEAAPSVTPAPSSAESVDTPSPSVTPEPEVVYAEVFAVEATADTSLRSGPGEDAEVGSLGPGDVAVVADPVQEVDGVEWYTVNHGEVFGWVSADTETLTFHRRVAQATPASLFGIDAGPSGFIA